MTIVKRVLHWCSCAVIAMALLSCRAHDAGMTPTPTQFPSLHPTLAPNPTISSLSVTPDGAIWYSYDTFDGVGGSPPGMPQTGIYHQQAGQIEHHDVPGTVRGLEVGPDGNLYAVAGCGLIRISGKTWESLAEVDCARSAFAGGMVSFDVAFAPDDTIWLAGIINLARFDGQGWVEYRVNARRLLVSTDGTIWAEGWNGRAGSDCCFIHVVGSDVVTYTHSSALPVSADEEEEIWSLLN